MIKNKVKPAPGHLLLSEPFMPDPNFKRTVIMLCEHLEDGGTVGFILNKSLNVKVCDALVDFDAVTNDLFYGGPVAKDTLHYLHRYGDIIEELPPNMPKPWGHLVIISAFVDANHAGNVITGCSHTGISIFIQNAPIIWFSK